ncbi:MAG: DUF5590 domain-containing protein [Streptococcaceae bacterium]|nr:DUF5590 domain-containing protein [Streptococcaceae bacterium]
MTKMTQLLMGSLLIILSLLIGLFVFYTQAMRPYTQAKQAAIRLAKAKTPVTTVKNFDITTTRTTTYSLIGQDKAGHALGVLIPATGGDIIVVKLADNQSKLNEKTAKLTRYKDEVVWQDGQQRLYAFKTGQQVNY